MTMEVSRGDVVLLNFEAQGAPIRKTRPAVVIQNDVANRVAPNTIVAAVHHDNRKGLPVHVPVRAGVGGLIKDSVIDLGFIQTVPKSALGRKLGRMPLDTLDAVDQAIRVSLALDF
ncbi:MAG: type II toxin-antitoxin system PemK/MazF family toxin [Elusimicrobia bacterium]|nr:type II toxin-antitoxin system PemK/MazF family toxin [Elusimicrobiota bacterium]